MEKVILIISAFIANTISKTLNYFNRLKLKFDKSKIFQLKIIIIFTSYISLMYFYIACKETSTFKLFYYFSSLCFLLFSILFYGFYLYLKNPKSSFLLKQYHNEFVDGKIITVIKPAKFLNQKSTSKLDLKPGRNNNYLKKICLKYYLIQKFYPEERLETKKYKSEKHFLDQIGIIEGVKPGSLKNHYPKIKYQDLHIVFKENKILFEELFSNEKFSEYPLCLKFLKQELKN